jgi:hypothetical protein
MKTKLLGGLIIGAMLLSACNGSNNSATDAASLGTTVAQTVAAISTSLAETMPALPNPVENNTPTLSLETSATYTPSPQATVAYATSTPMRVTSYCDLASFGTDVTIPDGTTITPGGTFTKTWRLTNAGTCTWTTSYQLVYVSEDAMGTVKSVSLSKSVAPGGSVDISVSMTAPTILKEYTGYWMLQNSAGARFGVGTDGSDPIYVNIKVAGGTLTFTPTGTLKTPTSTLTPTRTVTATLAYFAVVNTVITASPLTYSGICPTTITVSGTMTVSRAGTVKYHFKRGDGSVSGIKTLTFTAAGSQAISDSFSASASGTETVYIDDPNHQYLGAAPYTITCGIPSATPTTPVPTETPTPPTPTPSETPVTPT